MKKFISQSMGKVSMLKIYGSKKTNVYENENMPGGNTKPPEQQL